MNAAWRDGENNIANEVKYFERKMSVSSTDIERFSRFSLNALFDVYPTYLPYHDIAAAREKRDGRVYSY